MKVCTSKTNKVWYVDSSASNHMTNHEECFSDLDKPEHPRIVETGDNTSHPIEHAGNVPLSHIGHKGRLMNVMHVSTISLIKECRPSSPILGASSKKKGKSSHKGDEKGGCSSSTQTA